jgi:hypothetical protein
LRDERYAEMRRYYEEHPEKLAVSEPSRKPKMDRKERVVNVLVIVVIGAIAIGAYLLFTHEQ